MKEELEKMKKAVQEVKKEETSLAMSLLHDYKKANKRQFVIILVILTFWFCTIGYLVYISNDIGTTTTESIDIEEVETVDGSNIQIGDK